MNDLISRQAAIDALDKIIAMNYKDWARAQNAIRQLPSAQPEKCEDCGNFNKTMVLIPQTERKTGRWMIRDNHATGWYDITCSECGEDVTSVAPCIGFLPNARVIWDYCPFCGADMRGEQDDSN